MRITDGQGPIQPGQWPNRRPERAVPAPGSASRATDPVRGSAENPKQANATAAPADSEAPGDKDAIHRDDALRETVARLIESGDITAAEDAATRRARIDEARKKLEAGAYNRNDVIGGIVDRLLDQWKI
jgi:hypothetical protein